jgi:hypothetical protein
VQFAVFAKLLVGGETGGGGSGREGYEGQWAPVVFTEGGWDGLFAVVGELCERGVVLVGR